MASLAAGKEKTRSQKNAIKEALKIIKEADACLKTSMFNWKKDYLSAAPLYAKASNHYRMGKEPQKAIDSLVKAATCAAESGQEFEVGKPISRKFTISTRGISVTQVPQLLKNSDLHFSLLKYLLMTCLNPHKVHG